MENYLKPSSILASRGDQQDVTGQQGCVIWFTGLSGAGKSTLAVHLEKALLDQGKRTTLLDGDLIRQGLNRDLGFSPADREENIRRVAEVARLMADTGLIVCVSFITPTHHLQNLARQIVGPDRFQLIYVKCCLSECENRDPKGLYAKARSGEILQFTGISAPYEEPVQPFLVISTDELSIEQGLDLLLQRLVC